MGYIANLKDIVVTQLVHAGPLARRTKSSFSPDSQFQDKKVAKLYSASGRLDGYLGDWHTHPFGSHGMSSRDRRTLKQIAGCRTARVLNPVMLILSGSPWSISAWQLSRSKLLGRSTFTLIKTEFY